MPTKPLENIRCELSYHPHVAVIMNLDAEWTQRRGREVHSPFLNVQRRITHLCHEFSKGIKDNFDALPKSDTSAIGDSLDSFLYRPVFYVPWGHSDCQALVLLDDFEAIHHITAGIHSPIEEISLGFCPKLGSFGGSNLDSHRLIVDLNSKLDGNEANLGSVAIQREMPLLAFTRFKFDALASVGYALLFQEALYAALPKKLEEIYSSLFTNRSTNSAIAWAIEDEDDLNNLEVSFLDLQGAEELGSLIFCRNYSVAMTFIASLRSLTYRDLYKAGPAGEEFISAVKNSRILKSLLHIQPKTQANGPRASLDFLENHVFRWTHTTLSVSADANFGAMNATANHCNGWVSATSEYQIPPGHHSRLDERLKQADLGKMESKPVPPGVTLYQAGRGDFLQSFADPNDAKCIKLSDALLQAAKIRELFGSLALPDSGRDIVDDTTLLSVPIPDELPESILSPSRTIPPEHFALFGSALSEIQQRLCYPESVSESTMPRFSEKFGRLSLKKLKEIPRTYGVPVSLRRNIEYLYQYFAILLADYYAFDSVIDLYDAFATLHATLTEQLGEVRLAEVSGNRRHTIPPLDDARVEAISEFVDALHNALSHRLTNSFSEPSGRDMAINLRGGLNQILAAADATLKCGLGLLRKYAVVQEGAEPRRELVGGLTRITVRPGMRAFSLLLGTETRSQLCFVEADVPHVLHVASFSDYLHEAAHLIYATKKSQNPNSPVSRLSQSGKDNELLFAERLDEIFAYFLVRLFLFRHDEDPREFVVDQLISHEKSRNGSDDSDTETISQVTELLVRLCIADQLTRSSNPKAKRLTNHPDDRMSRRNAIERFLDHAKPALPERELLWGTPLIDGWEHAIQEFEHIYCDLYPYLEEISQWGHDISEKYEKDLSHDTEFENTKLLQEKLKCVVRDSLGEGRPLSRCRVAQHLGKDRDESGLDSLLMVCSMLSSYVTQRGTHQDKQLFLFRDPDGLVKFPKDVASWNAFLIDRGSASLFCCIPQERGRRTQQQVAILKSLWDIASQLRGRRMCEIIDDNWGLQNE